MIVDKKNILKSLSNNSTLDIELGCGPNKKHTNAIGVDLLDYDGVDIVGDVFEVLSEIPNDSINCIYSYHFLEHIADSDRLIKEMHRTLSSKGMLRITVPHFSNPFYYSDLTHKTHFGLYSFSYCATSKFKRKVPSYKNKVLFHQESIKLVFKSYPPRYIRHIFKKIFHYIFNINVYMQEFYEENLVYIFPCYEVNFTLRKK